ncbi:hypothetical protein K1Y32_10295 [Staphylococcus gallinarum]|nr:hypothetical protein [Staphylococcus gallinarum]MCD8829859.1 hypothetical protein [Staphylococcus gallinarum]
MIETRSVTIVNIVIYRLTRNNNRKMDNTKLRNAKIILILKNETVNA